MISVFEPCTHTVTCIGFSNIQEVRTKIFTDKNIEMTKQILRKSNRTRQKIKRGDRKGESNDSHEIPDRMGTSDIPSLPSGVRGIKSA